MKQRGGMGVLKTSIAATLGVLCILSASLNGCTGDADGADNNQGAKLPTAEERAKRPTLFQIGDEYFSIPSPVQTSFMIRNSGASYRKEMLNDPRKAPSYSTKFYRALNLGIYGADLGYVTLYDQTQDAISYLQSCKKIGDELGVAGAFSPELMKRFEANLGNQDSLLVLVSDAYRDSDTFLKNHDRNDVGSLILAGGWIESLHFASEVAQADGNADLMNRIGEQKISLENLIKLLLKFRSDSEDYMELVEHLEELWYLFEGVEISYVYEKPYHDEANKITEITSVSEVTISQDQLDAIFEKVESIRNQIVS